MLAALATSRLVNMSAAPFTLALSAFNNKYLTRHSSGCRQRQQRTQKVAAHPDKASPRAGPGSLSLATVLSKVRDAIRGNNPLDRSSSSNAMAFGMGQHMGCDVSWTFIWRPDGAFYEEIRSRHLTYKWGFDGGQDSPCWEVDPSGVSKELERDDREASLISAFIKSGNWLIPAVADKWLDIELEDQQAAATAGRRSGTGREQQLVSQYMPQVNLPPVATLVQHPAAAATATAAAAAAAAAAQPELAASQLLQQQQQEDLLEQQLLMHRQQDQQASSSLSMLQGQQQQQQHDPDHVSEDLGSRPLHVAVKLKGGRMLARVAIDSSSWQPHSFNHPLCSDTEKWLYGGWINWAKVTAANNIDSCNGINGSSSSTIADVYYPQVVLHRLHQDSAHRYNTHGVVVRGTDIHRAYQIPASPAVPIDAQYLQRYSERVPMWQTQGGHILVECFINSRRAGWMVLDTGASGLVIEPSVADHFGLPKFGDLKIAGVGGKVGTRFRRVSQLRIGPLLLSDPVMMEMKVSKLVSTFHDRVVGIAGFDVFRRCRITLPCHRTRMNLIKATGHSGKVQPYVGSMPTPAEAGSSSSRAAAAAAAQSNARWWELDQYQMLQQEAAEAVHAAEGGHTAAPRRSGNGTAAAAAAVASTAVSQQQQQQQGLRRRRRRRSSSSSSSSRSALQAVAAPAAAIESGQAEHLPQQQQQQRDLGILAHVPVVPRKYYFWQNVLIELLLQRPDAHGLEDGYIWQDVIMIASLPHVELEFVVPSTNKRHRSLFLLDTGAAGSEMMFHSRAARELQLLSDDKKHPTRFVTGVNGGGGPATPVVVQQGRLPEVVIRGQYGANPNVTAAVAVINVEALYSRVGGLDISLYAAGMVCVDLLHRMQVVIDYTNKRVGWSVPPREHLMEVA